LRGHVEGGAAAARRPFRFAEAAAGGLPAVAGPVSVPGRIRGSRGGSSLPAPESGDNRASRAAARRPEDNSTVAAQASSTFAHRASTGARALATIAACGVALAGCSWQQAYSSAQQWQRNACQRYPDAGERERCLASASQPYDDYRKRESHDASAGAAPATSR